MLSPAEGFEENSESTKLDRCRNEAKAVSDGAITATREGRYLLVALINSWKS